MYCFSNGVIVVLTSSYCMDTAFLSLKLFATYTYLKKHKKAKESFYSKPLCVLSTFKIIHKSFALSVF